MNKQIKCNTKKEIAEFLTIHKNCEMNSEDYNDGIELVFCKTHTDHEKSQRFRKQGTYVFVDTKEIKF